LTIDVVASGRLPSGRPPPGGRLRFAAMVLLPIR